MGNNIVYDYDKVYDRTDTNGEKYALRKKLFGTDDITPMWVADMDISTGDFIIDAIKERLTHPIIGYEEFPNSAKKAQIAWMKKNHNFKIKKNWILYSHSVVTSINIAIRAFTDEEDEIIVQTPVYPPFLQSIITNNRKVLENPLKKDKKGNYSFDLKDLKSKITPKTKLLLLCSPHNPVGRVWTKKELKELSKICLKNNIKVFSDEIHCDIVYNSFKHIPFSTIDKKVKDITITALGVGKAFNLSGIATSTVVISNQNLMELFKKEYKKAHLAEGNIFGHISFETAYKDGQKWLDGLKKHLNKNIKMLDDILLKHKDKITFIKPQGTYLAWLDCSKMDLTNSQLKKFFVKKAKLGLTSGMFFGEKGSLYVRLNFAVPSSIMDKALKDLDNALSS